MKGRLFLGGAIFALGLSAYFAAEEAQKPAGIVPPPPQLNLLQFLPAAPDLRGWQPKGPPQHYKGEDLFLYIDGGAEIYREYGFKQVIVQDYRDANDRSITLEIFEMANAESAYGMFSFKSGAKGISYSIGHDARLEDYYLNFWKGPLLITLIGFDASAECREGILRLARAAEARIPLTGTRPSLISVLPKEWADSARIIYLKGVLGLNNIHSFFPYDLFRFKEGLAAERNSSTLFIFRYANTEEAAARFSEVKKAFAKSPSYKDLKSLKADDFKSTDAKGNILRVELQGDSIRITLAKSAVLKK